jgi:hypothetical protein
MEIIAKLVGLTSGFALMRWHKAPIDMIATSVAVDVALAPLTAVIAARRSRSATRWIVVGLAFGMWALAYALLISPRAPGTPVQPPDAGTPNAA